MHQNESGGCHGHDDEGSVYVAMRPVVMDADFHLRQISDQLYCDAKKYVSAQPYNNNNSNNITSTINGTT